MKKHYTAEINPPRSTLEGLANYVQMIINEIEAGNTREALMKAVDLRQDLDSNASPYKHTAVKLDPKLNPEAVDIPKNSPLGFDAAIYSHDCHGAGACAKAARRLRNGEQVALAICSRNGHRPPVVRQVLRLQGLPGKKCIRVTGEGNQTDSAGSHTLIGSIYTAGDFRDIPLEEIAATIACRAKTCQIFLLKTGNTATSPTIWHVEEATA